VRFKFGANVGLSITTLDLKVSTYEDYYLEKTAFDNSYSARAGVFLACILPRTQGKWSIYNKLSLNSFTAKNSIIIERCYLFPTTFTTDINFTYLNLSHFLRYYIPGDKVNAFLSLGFTNGFAVQNKTAIVTEEINNSSDQRPVFIDPVKSFNINGVIAAGVRINKIIAEARVQEGDNISPSNSILDKSTML
jgi:hypothetical protein